ncbi:hypothetical protein MASR2M64_11650 [Candidatus Cloacimonadota bacterium]|nr:hypothetical protein [Candidatus Cloacimonadota bacterium]
MFDDDNELQLYEDFLQLAKAHPQCKAGNYIRELWEHKGTAISATELYTLYQPQFSQYISDDLRQVERVTNSLQFTSYPELPITFTDLLTIRDLGEFLQKLRCDLAEARENNDEGRICEDIATIEYLNDYILHGVTNGGKLKNIRSLVRDHARLIGQGVQYLVDSIQTVHPRLAEHIAMHIVIGVQCYWSCDAIRHRA